MNKKNYLLLGSLLVLQGFSLKGDSHLKTLKSLRKNTINAPLSWKESAQMYGLPAITTIAGIACAHIFKPTDGPFVLKTWTDSKNYTSGWAPIGGSLGAVFGWMLARGLWTPLAWETEKAREELGKIITPNDLAVLEGLITLDQEFKGTTVPVMEKLGGASFSLKSHCSDPRILLGNLVTLLQNKSAELQEHLNELDKRGTTDHYEQLSTHLGNDIGLLQALVRRVESTPEYAVALQAWNKKHADIQNRIRNESDAARSKALADEAAARAKRAHIAAIAENAIKIGLAGQELGKAGQEVRTAATGKATQQRVEVNYNEKKKKLDNDNDDIENKK